METQTHHDKHPMKGFMSEAEMQDFFSSKFQGVPKDPKKRWSFEMWYRKGEEHKFTYKHDDPIPPGKRGEEFNCDTITDEWFRWFLTTPSQLSVFSNPGNSYEDGRNAFLFSEKNTFVYFAAASPFRNPDFRRIVMTRKAPLLVPVYNMSASSQSFPSLSGQEIVDLIKTDLSGVLGDTVEAKLDGEDFYGCCVIRNEPVKITNIPKNNIFEIPEDRLLQQETGLTMDLYHGGFWLLIKEDKFTPGDHLLYFKANSVNYEMEAKILISVLVGKEK
jgi:hypothetical protein